MVPNLTTYLGILVYLETFYYFNRDTEPLHVQRASMRTTNAAEYCELYVSGQKANLVLLYILEACENPQSIFTSFIQYFSSILSQK